MITPNDVSKSRNGRDFVCEASDLSLRGWPASLPTTIGDGTDFVRTSKRVDDEGDILHVRYVQKSTDIHLIVIND